MRPDTLCNGVFALDRDEDFDVDMERATEPSAFVVAVYELDRHYGGPEEGGWWYDSGTLVRVLRAFKRHQYHAAYDFAARVNRTLTWRRRQDRHYRSIDSMLYAGGHLHAEVYEDTAPTYYPQERPHYE